MACSFLHAGMLGRNLLYLVLEIVFEYLSWSTLKVHLYILLNLISSFSYFRDPFCGCQNFGPIMQRAEVVKLVIFMTTLLVTSVEKVMHCLQSSFLVLVLMTY